MKIRVWCLECKGWCKHLNKPNHIPRKVVLQIAGSIKKRKVMR